MQKHWLIPLGGALALAACNKGPLGTFTQANKQALFLDAPVQNLAYGEGRRTDADGLLLFAGHELLEFRIGDIVLGSTRGRALITPVTLVPGAADEERPEQVAAVSNIARFLQTLDVDLTPANGIEIPEDMHQRAIGQSLDFSLDPADFERESEPVVTLLTRSAFGSRRELVGATQAEAHLAGSLSSALTGIYRGELSGDLDGRFEVFVDRSGRLCGWAEQPALFLVESLLGQVGSGGLFTMSAAVFGGMRFTGQIEGGQLSGQWTNPTPDLEGLLIGDRVEAIDAFLGAGVTPLIGTYVGSSSLGDELMAVVDQAGNVEFTNPFVCGALLTIDAEGRGRMLGVSIQGDLVEGTLDPDGSFVGSFETFGGSGSFELLRE